MDANPLLKDEKFSLTVANPSPSSSKTKEGAKYRVSFELTREEWDWFMEADTAGMVVELHHCMVTHRNGEEVNDCILEGEPSPESSYGYEAQQLWQSGFFYIPAVWKAAGTPDEYLDHIRTLPSCITKRFNEYIDGTGRSIPCHVRRADNSGTSIKPDWFVVPMTHDEHSLQHQHGELALLTKAKKLAADATADQAKEWFNRRAMRYVSEWAADKLKFRLGYDSFAQVPPESLALWATDAGLYDYLPSCYKVVPR